MSKLQALGEYVVVKITKKPGSIVRIDFETHEQKKSLLEEHIEIYSSGDKCTRVKPGDTVLVHPLAPLPLLKKGKVKEIMGKKIDENERYGIVKEDNIMCVINK